MEWIYKIHEGLPRQGPGDMRSTHKAYTFLKDLPPLPNILDMGCGPGKQTLDLAKITNGHITALDNYQPYLDLLELRVKSLRLEENISAVLGDMRNPDFPEGHFDLIWSEGAVYIAGFENGLTLWKRLLRADGYMAVTEISWMKDTRPGPIAAFWQESYPAMQNIEQNLATIEKCGYEMVEHFTLPESSWWEDYYLPLRLNIQQFKESHAGNEEALAAAALEEHEIELFEEFSDYYGYVFYVMQVKS